jgi:hypothetical protein
MQTELTKQKLAELAADPANQVYYYPEEEKQPEPSLTVQEARNVIQEIRARAAVLHTQLPDWSVEQIQNKLCRENPSFAAFSLTHSLLWTKVSAFDAPAHHLKHVQKMLEVLERQEKKEITMEEARQLIAFYMTRHTLVKQPKRKTK